MNDTARATLLSLAAAAAIGTMTSAAFALPYRNCVRATAEPFGCLNERTNEAMVKNVRVGFRQPDRETLARTNKMHEAGLFKPYAEMGEAIAAGKLRRTCELSDLLDVIEKAGRETKMVAEACYARAE